MKIFEKIKAFFNRIYVKKLAVSLDTQRIVNLIKKEKDIKKVEEMLSNYSSVLTSLEFCDIISKYPMKSREELLLKFKKFITPYDLCDFLIKKLDTSHKLSSLGEFKYNLDLYDLYEVLENISPDKREEALDIIADRLDSYELSEVIQNYIPAYCRKDMLYKYESILDSISKVSVIKSMPSKDIIDALEKYKDEILPSHLSEILDNVNETNLLDALDKVSNNLTEVQIADFISYKLPEKQRLDALVKFSDLLTKGNICDIIKYSIDDVSDKKKALILLKDKIDEKHIAEIIQYYMIDDKELIEKLKDKLYEEDKIYFSQNQAV